MGNLKPKRLLLVKIAAIGDVVLACRALLPFLEAAGHDSEIHWLIDTRLQPLAESLIHFHDQKLLSHFYFHPIDSSKLFQGSFADKLKTTLSFFLIAQKVLPTHIALLHRDKRYLLPFKANPTAKLVQAKRAKGIKSEFELYSEVFMEIFGTRQKNTQASNPSSHQAKKIGILVGGGKNAKTVFLEKRWPHLKDFIELVLQKTDLEVALYGGTEDSSLAQELKQQLNSTRLTDQTAKHSLAELPVEFSSLAAFVGIDSGLTHIAATVMTSPTQKVIALYGPTSPITWAPPAVAGSGPIILSKKLECSPCYDDSGDFKPCKFSGADFQKCMKEITPSEVLRLLAQ